MTERITIAIQRHRATGLLAAVSGELRGLMAVGRSIEELMAELPMAIEGLLKIERGVGVRVLGIDPGFNPGDASEEAGWADYEVQKAVATYELLAA